MVQDEQLPTSFKDEYCRQLESIARGMINAINTRDFDPGSKAWTPTSISFTSEVAFNTRPTKTNLYEYLAEVDNMTKNSPGLQLHILSLDASLGPGAFPTHGNVFANLEWRTAQGSKRPCYAIYDFIRSHDRWVCVKYRALPGIAAGSNASEWAK